MMRRVFRGARDERGATAILVALASVVLFGAAAVGVDIANLTMERQELHDAVDAAAQAAAYDLPATTAATTATTFAKANDLDANPTSEVYCVVEAVSGLPNVNQLGSTCTPDGTKSTSGWKCNADICSKKCTAAAGAKCNTVRVEASKDVPYFFAPVIGYNKGNTGVVASAACKGSCGAETPNPMDVVVLADRTASLSASDRAAMVSAIKSMMTTMDPTMHFLSVGTIDKSAPTSSCSSAARPITPGKTLTSDGVYGNFKVNPPWTASNLENSAHKWIPTDFSRDYNSLPSGATTRVAKATDPVYKSVNCLNGSEAPYGTHLAAPFKEGARKLLGLSDSNLDELTAANPRPGDDKTTKVLILETDGAPNEFVNSGTSANWAVTGSASGAELRNVDGNTACNNLLKVAESAKAQKILVITIGFGEVTSAQCDRWNDFGGKTGSTAAASPNVRDVLAAAASPHPGTGAASTSNTCTGSSAIAAENADGDFFFCAANGSELSDIFRTAISQVSKGIRLVKLPQ